MTQIKEETEESFRLLQELDEKMCGKTPEVISTTRANDYLLSSSYPAMILHL